MNGRKNNAISIEKRVAGTSGRYVGRIDGVDGTEHDEAAAVPASMMNGRQSTGLAL